VVKDVEEKLKGVEKPLKIAIMGCVVNAIGEAREADRPCLRERICLAIQRRKTYKESKRRKYGKSSIGRGFKL